MKSQTPYVYLAVITPSPSVFREITTFKTEFKDIYGLQTATSSMPHTTLSIQVLPVEMEEKIVNTYRRIATGIAPFDIQLSDFEYFKGNTYTIYVNILSTENIIKIVKYLKQFSKPFLSKHKDFPPFYTNHPHLTIAKGIPESMFNQVWPTWRTKNYKATFRTEGMLLLKKPLTYLSHKYENVGFFPFKGETLLENQLTLNF